MLTPIINLVAVLMFAVSTAFGGIFASAPGQVTIVSATAVPDVQPVATEQPAAAVPSVDTYQRIAELLANANQSSEYSTIERGHSGEAVLQLQQRLAELGYYTGTPSGKMDSATQLAFKKFEKANGFTANGIASPEEQEVLFSQEAVAAQ